jgi:hypothetical protein
MRFRGPFSPPAAHPFDLLPVSGSDSLSLAAGRIGVEGSTRDGRHGRHGRWPQPSSINPGGSHRRNCNVHLDELRGDRPDCEPQLASGVCRNLRLDGTVLPDNLGAAGDVPCDDILDAAAAAWSAHRIAKDMAASLPDPPQFVDGQSIAIWY